MAHKLINPESLGSPRGYSNGVLSEATGRSLFVAGQLGWNREQRIVSADFVAQFDQALANVIEVVKGAGGRPDQITRLAMYVTDRSEYREHTREIGECYRRHMGKHFPAMVLLEVKGLLDTEAKIEIEATAII